MPLSQICDAVIFFSAVLVAIRTIYEFFAKPTSKFKQHQMKIIDDRVQQSFKENFDKEITNYEEKRNSECETRYQELMADVSDKINNEMQPRFDEIMAQNKAQNENINLLITSSKDMLRQRIMWIYHSNKNNRSLTVTEKEILDELLKDYKAENGNSYIAKYANRMSTWEITPDDYDTKE